MSESNHFEEDERVPIIREFLYADLDRVRSLLAQRAGGVPEEDRVTESASKKFNIGIKNYLGYASDGRAEEYLQRSLLDALFPELEELLEAEGWLTDISDIFHDESEASPDNLSQQLPPGSIIRLTADGYLLDTQYIAQVLGGVSVAADAVARLTGNHLPTQQEGQSGPDKTNSSDPPALEDQVIDFNPAAFGGTNADMLRNFIRLARGVFSPGLHMVLDSSGPVNWSVTSRLQQGRRYLDAEPEILFSRFGTKAQSWTIVGTIGHYAQFTDMETINSTRVFRNDKTVIDRLGLVNFINDFISGFASLGLADTPPQPGFSVVPLAVYRTVPRRSTPRDLRRP